MKIVKKSSVLLSLWSVALAAIAASDWAYAVVWLLLAVFVHFAIADALSPSAENL